MLRSDIAYLLHILDAINRIFGVDMEEVWLSTSSIRHAFVGHLP